MQKPFSNTIISNSVSYKLSLLLTFVTFFSHLKVWFHSAIHVYKYIRCNTQ